MLLGLAHLVGVVHGFCPALMPSGRARTPLAAIKKKMDMEKQYQGLDFGKSSGKSASKSLFDNDALFATIEQNMKLEQEGDEEEEEDEDYDDHVNR